MTHNPLDTIPHAHRAPIVIVSASRSGSTLLQRALNMHPRLTIWGEHFGILGPLGRSLQMLSQNDKNLRRGHAQSGVLLEGEPERAAAISTPHTNPFDLDQYRDQLRRFVLELFAGKLAPDVRWGFKEIHYRRINLIVFRELFPDTRFIVLTRDPPGQISSMIRAPWRPRLDSTKPAMRQQLEAQIAEMADDWHSLYASLREFSEESTETVLRLRYRDLTSTAFPTERIFDHLRLDPPLADHLALAFGNRLGSSDESGKWTATDRDVIDEIVANHPFPDDHAEIVDYFLS